MSANSGDPRKARLVAQIDLSVELYVETEPGRSNPIVGTELPYEYLVVRAVSDRGTFVTSLKNHLALLDWSDEPLDVDGLVEETIREALSVHAPNPYGEGDK